jgi:hypothetical protein
MSAKEKLAERLAACPSDFTWQECTTLLRSLGCRMLQGKGSRVRFVFSATDGNITCYIHKPHPGNTLDRGRIEDLKIFVDTINHNEGNHGKANEKAD